MIKRLRLKFICVNMLIVTVMLCIILGLVLHFTGVTMRLQSVNMMRSIAAKPFQTDNPGEVPSAVRLPFFSVQVDQTGQLITANSGYYDLSDWEVLEKIVQSACDVDREIGELKDYNLRYCKVASPTGQNIVFSDTTSEQTTLHNLLYSCLLIGFGALLLFLVISILLAQWAVKPVDNAWTQQRQFVADASHELKTPLAVIMANAELLQNDHCSEEERNSFVRRILSTTYQMRTLVENLLEMARVDNGAVTLNMTALDFSQLVRDAVLSVQLLYEEQGIGLCSTIPEGIRLQGSEAHLYQVLDVLLDNALKYTPSGGNVRVWLERRSRSCLLQVTNTGDPIPKSELKNIFKRFYRADRSRTRNGSCGLGLAIAESIVAAHRGKIWAESRAEGNTFCVVLPI